MGREPECRRDQADIEKNWGQGWNRKAVEGVHDAASKSGHRDKEEIGKGDPQHLNRQLKLAAVMTKTGRKDNR